MFWFARLVLKGENKTRFRSARGKNAAIFLGFGGKERQLRKNTTGEGLKRGQAEGKERGIVRMTTSDRQWCKVGSSEQKKVNLKLIF